MLHTWGECTRQVPGHLSCTDLGRTQKAGPTESVFLCGEPENLNLSGLDLESAYNLGPTSDSSWQSNLEPEQCRLGKHTRCERGQTRCGRDTTSTPCKHLLAVFLPPHSTTKQVSLK